MKQCMNKEDEAQTEVGKPPSFKSEAQDKARVHMESEMRDPNVSLAVFKKKF